MKVNVSAQVRDYVRRLAPDSRRRLRAAILLLESERGDIKSLEEDLECSPKVEP
jgi:hypothetical protein